MDTQMEVGEMEELHRCGEGIHNEAWNSSKRHSEADEEFREGTGIFVRGLDASVRYEQLKVFFSAFGQVERIRLNRKRMFAIVEFRHRHEAELILSREIFFHGRKLNIVPRKGSARITKVPYSKLGDDPELLPGINSDLNKETVNERRQLNKQSFESQVNQLMRRIQAVGVDSHVKLLCNSLDRVLSPHFPECQIYPFGSSVTGLSLKESDVDIFVDLGKLHSQDYVENCSGSLVLKTKKILSQDRDFARCLAIPKARVPIVKCFHKATRLNCDINFQNALGTCNSNLIKLYLAMMPRLKTILIILKYWGKVNQIIGPGNLTSYALVMLMLYYLQQLPNEVLPTVETLQDMCMNVVKICGWECHFKWDVRNLSSKLESTLKVLEGFFSFYSIFNFSDNVIILKTASVVPKHIFFDPPEGSPSHKYKMVLERVKAKEPIQLDKVMCMLDPFVLDHNITASVRLRTLNKFQIKCFKWKEIMQRIEKEEDEGIRFQSLFKLDPRIQKIKFPYLEYWKEGNVKLFVPLSSFNPKNTFEVHDTTSSDFGKIESLIIHLKYIFEKVLRFSMFREERDPDETSTDKQIQKTDGMEDVREDGSFKKELKSLTMFYECYYHVWMARSSAYKQFSFPISMPMMEKEMHVTNYLLDTYYKEGTTGLTKMVIKCIFVPIMENRCLDVQILLCDGGKPFQPMITLLLNLLHKWLEK